ncbi:hypothetical protein HanRHA438_Chr05g0206391 [Helianthus annuus]|uniref:Uncharacterized protein n=1 Tax=Helianthus annuus TaxID=4232 RepID=A0A251UPE6_HELAN|nr:hypothetical protein HanXRQr2_Chr05g0196931 [Helianthus annuus]KAJ0569065.1 hypothetical protein HanHA300_Chr05g0161811 [Helianthus annuus]KAJ0575421.1 hypothetical protein HanIR_Chr05g0212531 [Helianthus annuus]KAJ0583344.1 hypothetical protein HanHA89_Chr05g0175481 [Helianthus annuus]KAJ0746078.1 hypothetical protein HanOQP8_Chr05g0173401 [Helianthus annuus]
MVPSSAQHRHHSISSAVPWFFLSLLFLYIIYYSTLLFQPAPTFTTKTCLNPDHTENLQTNTSKETQTQVLGFDTELKHIAFGIAASSTL